MGGKSSSHSKERLFDAFENFNHELAKARQERGEPAGGIERVVFEAGERAEGRGRKIGLGLLAAASVLGGVFALRYVRERMGELPESVKETGENQAA